MEKIEFRGLTEWGDWVYGGLYDDKIVRNREDIDSPIYLLLDRIVAVKKESIGQYIGLKDKNKRKIYEGDLIKLCDKLIGKIEYNKEISAFVIRYLNSKKYKCLGKWISCYKVIGSIYKNPELL